MTPFTDEEAGSWILERPASLIICEPERRNGIVKAVLTRQRMRRSLVIGPRRDYPWALQPHYPNVEKFGWRYMVAGPGIPLSLAWCTFLRHQWLFTEGVDVAFAGMPSGKCGGYRQLAYAQAERRVFFTTCPLWSTRYMHLAYKWLNRDILGPTLEWRGEYFQILSDELRVFLGFKNVENLLAALNLVTFPPLTVEDLWQWTQDWIARRREWRDLYAELPPAAFVPHRPQL